MKLDTRQFGTLDFDANSVITFPAGLLGFEALHDFVVLDQPEVAPLQWLQSVDDPQLAFTIVDPALVFADYQPVLTDEDRQALELPTAAPALVRVLVTVPSNPSEMTANLLGPLVINPERGKGRQVVLHDSEYPVRQRLLPEPAAV
jgi:flagellar assembly factor FliW